MKARIQQETECRSLLATPMEQREDTTRTLVNGPLAQGTNLALGGGLLALGVVGFASIGSCASPPCSADERKRSDTRYAAFGGIATGLALIPLGLFAWNIFRARDEARVVGLAPRVEGTPWRACGSLPLSNASLALHAGNVDLAGKTDSNGEVTFALKGIAASTSDPNEAVISADQQKAAPATVTLSATPSYASWSAARHADHDAQLAKLAQAQRERDEATAKRNEQVARLKGECAKNKGESCYQLGDSLSGTDGIQYLQAACELKHKVACTTRDARAREAERAAAVAQEEQTKRAAAEREAERRKAEERALATEQQQQCNESCGVAANDCGARCGGNRSCGQRCFTGLVNCKLRCGGTSPECIDGCAKNCGNRCRSNDSACLQQCFREELTCRQQRGCAP